MSSGRSGRRGWVPWIVFNLLLAGSFLAVLVVSRTAVGCAEPDARCKVAGRPPSRRWPIRSNWPAGLITTHTGSMMGYPVGGPGGGSTRVVPLAVGGLGLLVRRRQRLAAGVLLLPLGLNFVAAALHRFPYGEHMKLRPLFGHDLLRVDRPGQSPLLLAWLARRRRIFRQRLRRRAGGPCADRRGSIVLDLMYPYKSDLTLRSRDFAQWFWFDLAHESELVCLQTDLEEGPHAGHVHMGLVVAVLVQSADLFAASRPRRAAALGAGLRRAAAAVRAVSRHGARPRHTAGWTAGWRKCSDLHAGFAGTAVRCRSMESGTPAPRIDPDYIEVFKFVPPEGKRRRSPLPPRGSAAVSGARRGRISTGPHPRAPLGRPSDRGTQCAAPDFAKARSVECLCHP